MQATLIKCTGYHVHKSHEGGGLAGIQWDGAEMRYCNIKGVKTTKIHCAHVQNCQKLKMETVQISWAWCSCL